MTIFKPMALSITLLAATASTASAQTELSFNIFLPPTHFMWPEFEAWASDIVEATNGEVRITFPAQSVAPPAGVLDAVRNRVVDGGVMLNNFIAAQAPGVLVTQMPFTDYGDSEAISSVLWQTYQENFSEIEQIRGVELVSMFHLGPMHPCSVTDQPISDLADLQTRRVWALPGPVAQTLTAMNLAITASPAVQLQELVSRNTVDAYLGQPTDTIVAFGLAPYTKSCTESLPALNSASFSIFFNARVWDRLPDVHRDTIMQFSGDALARRLGRAANVADDNARAELVAAGIEFYEMSPQLNEAMRTAAQVVTDEWAEAIRAAYGIDAAPLIEATRAAVEAASDE